MDYGATFQKIREEKGLKRSDLADDSVSASMIGKFERGDSRLSFDRVVHLVEKMMLNVDEFLYAARDGEPAILLERELYKFDVNGNMGRYSAEELYDFSLRLKRVLKAFPNDLSLQFGSIFFEVLALERHYMENKTLMNEQAFQKRVNEKFQPILDYLMRTETWGRQDISLFILTLNSYEPEARLNLMKRALKRLDHLYHLMPFAEPQHRLLISAISVTAYDADRRESAFYLSALEEILIKHPSLEFRLRLEYEKGRFQIANGDIEAGYAQAKRVLDAMKPYTNLADEETSLQTILDDYVRYWQTPTDPERVYLRHITLYGL